ncbi:MAG: Hsp33 family molecular chaperone HslO [Silvanigrellales bacterium]|jgi:molecular chaperone Hsp33|nr:Hsp33 family molecular chaperone HslO [Silvanigrellales bacterium]
MFQDYLLYATDVEVRYAYRMVHLSRVVQQAQALHGLGDERAILLGEALLAGCLVSSALDDDERLNLRVQCGDDFTLATETTSHLDIRGYIACEETPLVSAIDLGERPLAALIIRTLRAKQQTGKIFEGVTKFLTNSVEEAINDHMRHSYQVNARLRIDCWKDPTDGLLRAFGVIYLALPNIDSDVASHLWEHVDGLPLLRELYARSDDPDALAKSMIPDDTRPVRSVNPRWSCACSQESVERMLISIPQEELQDMVRAGEALEIKCHYCSTNYAVSIDRQKELLASLGAGEVSSFKH